MSVLSFTLIKNFVYFWTSFFNQVWGTMGLYSNASLFFLMTGGHDI